jgi:hypothetical protein
MRERDAIYTKLIGSMTYNSFEWKFTIGSEVANTEDVITNILGISADDYLYLRYKVRVQNQITSAQKDSMQYTEISDLKKKSYKEQYEKVLGRSITVEQFEEYWGNQYSAMSGKGDFAHLSIIMATYLYEDYKDLSALGKFVSRQVASVMGGTDTLHELAGWLGDSTIPVGAEQLPVFGKDDYIADLDSLNIYVLMRDNPEITYSEAFHKYYTSLANGGNRAEIFLQHTTMDHIKYEIQNQFHFDYSIYSFTKDKVDDYDDLDMEEMWTNAPDTYNFIRSLEERDNTMRDYASFENGVDN